MTLTDKGTWLLDRIGGHFLEPSARIGLLAIAVSFVIGAFAYRYYYGRDNFSVRAYLRHAFPRRVYWSRTFAVDVQIMVLDRLFLPMVWFARVLSTIAVAGMLAAGLTAMLGPMPVREGSALTYLVLATLLLLVMDFGTYVTHRLSHQVPLLWAFHRVHHSAEELNPLTLMRKHPVYNVLGVLVDCITVAPLQGVIVYLFGVPGELQLLAMANMGFIAFSFLASNLRHTHIWLSYGPVLDKILVSPALHQIHHSRAEKHFDTNYGEVLAIWDWLFGTHYQPREREDLEFGIGDEAVQPHPTLAAAMLEPFVYAWRTIRPHTCTNEDERPADQFEPDAQSRAHP